MTIVGALTAVGEFQVLGTPLRWAQICAGTKCELQPCNVSINGCQRQTLQDVDFEDRVGLLCGHVGKLRSRHVEIAT